MTRFLRDAAAKSEGEVWDDICGTGVRIGATNEMFNTGLEMIFVILRGGWDYSSWCKAFEYQVCETSSVAVGGRALAGWKYPRKICHPPKLVFRSQLDERTVNELDQFLLQTFSYASWILPKLVKVMCATTSS